jgi:replicative DNA helicase
VTDRVPPQDVEAEMSVVGSMIISRRAIEDVVGVVGAGDFYRPPHEMIFTVIVNMHGRGEPVDSMTLAAELTREGLLSRVGGFEYIHTLTAFVPTASNVAFYAHRVAEVAVYRRMVAAGMRIAQMGFEGVTLGGQVDAAVEAAKEEVDAVGGVSRASVTTFADVADDAIDMIGKARFTPTPWRGLNRMIYGWMPGRMYSLSARPATGKTMVAVQASIDAARGKAVDPLGVAYYTFEMSGARLFQRGISYLAGVDGERMQRPDVELSEPEWHAISKATGELRTLPFVVENSSGWTAARVAAHARAANRRMPLGLVVVDHIGLVAAPERGMSEQAVLADAADMLLRLAHDLDAAVLTVTQLNRGPAERKDGKPRIEDIRGSDKVEQDSDVSMLLHRDKLNTPGELDLLVAKNRDGQDGRVFLRFEGQYSRVSDRDPSAPVGVRR